MRIVPLHEVDVESAPSEMSRGVGGGALITVMPAHITASPLTLTTLPEKPLGAEMSRIIDAAAEVSRFICCLNAFAIAATSSRQVS